MKRNLLIISCVVLFALQGIAQKGTNVIGLKFGPNINWVNSASDAAKNNRIGMGFSSGIVIDHYYSQHMAVSSGLNYSIMRLNYQFTDYRLLPNSLNEDKIPVNRKFKGSYIEVPLKIKAKMNILDSWNAFVEGGVGVGVNLITKGKDSYEYYGNPYSDEIYYDVSKDYRRLQFALNFGAGAEYEVNSKFSLFAQLTYHHTLSNMFSNWLYEETGSNIKTNFIGLEIGILH
jgi:hypothetical protein